MTRPAPNFPFQRGPYTKESGFSLPGVSYREGLYYYRTCYAVDGEPYRLGRSAEWVSSRQPAACAVRGLLVPCLSPDCYSCRR